MNKLIAAGILVVVLASVAPLVVPMKVLVSNLKEANVELGAAPGPDFDYERPSFNGYKMRFFSSGYTSATTTPCAFQARATSSIEQISAGFNVSTTTAHTLTFATSTVSFSATSSLLMSWDIAANDAQGFSWVPTSTAKSIIGKNHWIVFGIESNEQNSAGTFSPTGSCNVRLNEILGQ
jgi:hypothetical protein